MKKLLIASTALVATAGVAAADVNLSGGARFGAVKDSSGTRLETRYTLNLDGSTETDSGMEFFARVRLRADETKTGMLSGARVGVKSNGLTIAAGNIAGALDSMAGLYGGGVGFTGLGDDGIIGASHAFSSTGAGSNGAEIIYSANGMTAHLSATSASEEIALAYAFGDWTVSLGHGTAAKETALAASGSFGSVGVGVAIGKVNAGTNARVNASFSVAEGTTVQAQINKAAGADTAYGLGVSHDLGGATLGAGVYRDAAGETNADFGVKFSF